MSTDSDLIESRNEIIVKLYRKYFGESLPVNKQYWTACALCQEYGQIKQGTELFQMTDCGLIHKKQYNGVNIDKKIFTKNKILKGVHFYTDDIYLAMSAQGNKFCPGIVNYESHKSFDTEKEYLRHIFCFLQPYNNLLFTFSVRVNNCSIKNNIGNEVIEYLRTDDDFSYYLKKNWENEVLTFAYDCKNSNECVFRVGLIKNLEYKWIN